MRNIIILALTVFFSLGLNAQANWVLQKDKNGIKVYTKTVETSKLKASKVEMIVDAKPERILEVLSDIPKYTEWNPKTTSAKLLKKNNEHDFYYHSEISAPMVSNRDLVVHVKVNKKTNTLTVVDMTGVPDYIPHKSGLVRMPEYKGIYHIKQLPNGTTELILEYMANPGGKLPDWMVNTAAVDVPFELFTKLRDLF